MTRPSLGWSDLRRGSVRGAGIGLWGLGREGHAALRKLRAMGIEPVLVDDAPGEAGVLKTTDGGLDALMRCEFVIKTPGISPYGPEADRLRAAGVTLAGGLGLWANEADLARVVYVTGTKGKSTTSSVIGHLLRGLGYRTMVGGNFGVAPYDPREESGYDYWVIEVSSYTATDLAVSPPVTAVTALHPDHLPWHGGVERYYSDKLSAASQPGADLTVANGDSDLLRERAGLLGPRVEWIGETDDPGATWMDHLGLPGRHNRRNALIARAVLCGLGDAAADGKLASAAADDQLLASAAAGFTPLPSRLTPVGTVHGVTFIDDSLSTNVLPTLAALDSFPGRRVALIVGGQDRGIDYRPLAEAVLRRGEPTLVLTLPDSGPRISAAFDRTAASAGFAGVADCPDLDTAVKTGYAWAKGDGIVLLSPAAPSFGHFRDYRDRGDHFAAAMRTCTA
ncbi:MAG TPA: UDP-N-acetylmuramoyl-L-alanine--D-glutamate ligase [Trebonia sp.]